ncbi:Protein BUD31-like 2 [Glycine soja]|uniref:Protein BUD31-like 2 n=1 Tax=Glycine soja TaxID=3848 RepID=A0A445KPA0_GLYSO|nr:Protein BUD31-like 2 [Glycine soja]
MVMQTSPIGVDSYRDKRETSIITQNQFSSACALSLPANLSEVESSHRVERNRRRDTKMPKVKTNRVKYPEGWELIEPTLRELQAKMREAENDPHDGKRKCETLWPIFKIAHQKSRYIFDLYHRRKEISKELYEFCLDQGYADRNLIAKWKKDTIIPYHDLNIRSVFLQNNLPIPKSNMSSVAYLVSIPPVLVGCTCSHSCQYRRSGAVDPKIGIAG